MGPVIPVGGVGDVASRVAHPSTEPLDACGSGPASPRSTLQPRTAFSSSRSSLRSLACRGLIAEVPACPVDLGLQVFVGRNRSAAKLLTVVPIPSARWVTARCVASTAPAPAPGLRYRAGTTASSPRQACIALVQHSGTFAHSVTRVSPGGRGLPRMPRWHQRATMLPEGLPAGPRAEVAIVDGATASVSVAVVNSRTEAEPIVGMLRSHGVSAAVSADDAEAASTRRCRSRGSGAGCPADEASARAPRRRR